MILKRNSLRAVKLCCSMKLYFNSQDHTRRPSGQKILSVPRALAVVRRALRPRVFQSPLCVCVPSLSWRNDRVLVLKKGAKQGAFRTARAPPEQHARLCGTTCAAPVENGYFDPNRCCNLYVQTHSHSHITLGMYIISVISIYVQKG